MALSNQTGRLAPQSMLRERYIILGLAGRGGMGSVYKATDTQDNDRRVAIKEMSQAHLSLEKLYEAQERFRLESEMLGKLKHPNLPRVLDSFTESGRSYLVMDFIEGKTLLQLLTENVNQQLLVEQVLSYAIQLCDVLDYLHTQSPPIVFRDLKPSNVMVTAQGEVYLIDFGIARHFTQGKQQDTIPLGSEGFCPPEQFGTGQTSPRSDLYSLGATLHYSLTGKNPRSNKPTLFDFAPVSEMNQQVPSDLNKLILWLVATREEQRPETAHQVRQLLQAIEQWTTASTTQTRKSKALRLIRMNSGHFYDTKTARAALARQWLNGFNRLPGRAGEWAGLVLIPFLALISAQIETWLLLFALPIFQQLQELSNGFFRRIMQSDEQTLFFERFLKSPIWTPYFGLLFLLTPLLLGAGSLYLLNEMHSPTPFIVLGLNLFLLLFTLGSYKSRSTQSVHTRQLLTTQLLILLMLALSLLSHPEVQSALRQLTLNQLTCCLLLGLALFSFLRPHTRFAWVDHISMTLTIATFALLQYNFGVHTFTRSNGLDQLVNNVLVGILGGIALTTALRIRQPFTWGERLLLCVLACIIPGLQYAFGLQEIAHVPLILSLLQVVPLDPLDLVSLNILLVVGPPVLTLLWLFLPLTQRSARLARFPLVILAASTAGLLNFFGGTFTFPNSSVLPLNIPISSLFNLAQILAGGMLILIILLILPLGKRLRWLNHGAIFSVSLTCAMLQNTAWDKNTHLTTQQGQAPALLSSSIIALDQPQFYAAACNKLLAQGLILVVICAFVLVGILFAARFLGQFAHLASLFQRRHRFWSYSIHLLLHIEHALLITVTITCLILYWFFGNSSVLLRFTPAFFSLGQIILSLLLPASLFVIVRIARPMGRGERMVIQLDALACAFLLWHTSEDSSVLSQVQNWHISLAFPLFFIPLCLFLVALISLLWLKGKRPERGWTRKILLFLLGGAVLCICLQGFGYSLVLIGLLLLIEGNLLAVQIEK